MAPPRKLIRYALVRAPVQRASDSLAQLGDSLRARGDKATAVRIEAVRIDLAKLLPARAIR